MKLGIRLFVLPLATVLVALAGAPSFGADQADKASRLDTLYAQYWEEYLEFNPLAATFQGDPRYNDRLPNFLSEEYRQKSHDFHSRWLERIESVGSEGLDGQDLISYQIFTRDAKQELASEKFPDWQQPVNQFRNLAGLVAQFGSGTSAQPFKTAKDYDDWLKRASQVPAVFDQAIANMNGASRPVSCNPRH